MVKNATSIPAVLVTLLNGAVLLALLYLLFLAVKYLKRKNTAWEKRKARQEPLRTLGETLRFHREQQRMTQEFVAEKLGVSRQAVSKWESGRADPSTGHLMALAELWQVAPEELVKETKGL